MIAVMAWVIVNRTSNPFKSRPKAIPTDPPPEPVILSSAQLAEEVQRLAPKVDALDEKNRLLDERVILFERQNRLLDDRVVLLEGQHRLLIDRLLETARAFANP